MNASKVKLTEEEQVLAKKKGELDRKFRAMMLEIIWQIILLALMCWVVTGNQHPDVFVQNEHMKHLFYDEVPDVSKNT